MLRTAASFVALGLLATATLLAAAAGAAEHDEPREPHIVVTGTAKVRAAPERAFIIFAVESRDPNPTEAQRRNAKAMDAVFAALAGAGIAKDEMRTLSYELHEDFEWQKDRRVSRGFQARNAIEVRIDDLARIGEVIDVATAAGANSVGGVRFDVKDRTTLEREALTRATADARARAEAVAAGGGVRLGPLLRVEERGSFVPEPPTPYLARSVAADAAPETPIQPSEIEIRAEVVLTALIAR